MKQKFLFFALVPVFFSIAKVKATTIYGTPITFASKVPTLIPNDTLLLAAGIYTSALNVYYINGNANNPIVIMGVGDATAFNGNSCCNTVSLKACSYIIIKNLKLDGQNVAGPDGVKAEGTPGNWTHHITIENLTIVNYSNNQQQVGISTKCPSSNWVVRKNKIDGVGTGMYLGNSTGSAPFTNGIIENNYIDNAIGYNIEIKRQDNGWRDSSDAILAGCDGSGKTLIRHNVFSKGANSSTGANARPNVLVGGFPTLGSGVLDYYEIYGNFFYNNPTEALFQGCGNIMFYNNILVNHFDPSGIRTIYITPHEGKLPQNISIYHNTVWSNSSTGGIRIYNADTNFKQYIIGNVVFQSVSNAITSGSSSNTLISDNIIDGYSNAGNYVVSANAVTPDIATLDLYPKTGQLTGAIMANSLFSIHTDYGVDFNNDSYNWTYRGAYSGSGANTGWKLILGVKPTVGALSPVVPTLRFTQASITVNENVGTVSIPVKISNTEGKALTVNFLLAGTATSLVDYSVSPPTSVSFPANAVNGAIQNIVFTILKDGVMEPTESIIVTLISNPSNYQIGARIDTINIINATGIGNRVSTVDFKICPNPVNRYLMVNIESFSEKKPWEITNMLGAMVSAGVIEKEDTPINVDFLPAGIYIIKVGDRVRKFEKE